METRRGLRQIKAPDRGGDVEFSRRRDGDGTDRKTVSRTSATMQPSTGERKQLHGDIGFRKTASRLAVERWNMVAPPSGTHPAKRLLADIRDLAPGITARAAEIEEGRRIPPDLVETLRSIGIYRMLVPRSHGGLELDLPSALEVVRALAKIDGSVGWTVAIGCGGSIFAPLLPRETYDEVYRNGPDVILAGSAQPTGTAEATADGWRVSGRWPFASGCQHADWMVGLCMMTEGGQALTAGAPPVVRGCALPARDWLIEETWHVAGLKGSGSHHIALRDTMVPAANFFDLVSGVPCLPGPLYRAVRQVLPLFHGAVSVGIAEGAVDELVELANTGRQQLWAAVPMRESEAFQGELGRVAAELRAAQALLKVQADSHWRHALAGTLRDEALLTQSTQTATWLETICAHVADTCFALGGGIALYERSPLQRRMRDIHAAAQHAIAQQRNYAGAGELLLGDSVAENHRRTDHAR
jgi:alkylation response protein AidB-like acyl-CoA dehydrogenase